MVSPVTTDVGADSSPLGFACVSKMGLAQVAGLVGFEWVRQFFEIISQKQAFPGLKSVFSRLRCITSTQTSSIAGMEKTFSSTSPLSNQKVTTFRHFGIAVNSLPTH
ncbi:hypothetical protein AALP_AA7G254700 [Arabis alpina]|uniref:Uncharacterized protein n=1 Tax=Arabis alpina TaxID=50452 RepID=A0A087GKI8_ARAAL|nr:hypothetical protein AALP_AA7G254700 [Arabis alpina]